MEIGKYISQALKIHATVYVAQLGVFRKVHRPSTYDKDRQVYLPPLDYVEFDSLDQEGFSLSTFVQQSDNIQKTEAESSVRNAVETLRTRAEEDGEVYLDTLGHLIQYGNALIFKPQDLTGFALEPIPYVSEDDIETAELNEVSLPESDDPALVTEEEQSPLLPDESFTANPEDTENVADEDIVIPSEEPEAVNIEERSESASYPEETSTANEPDIIPEIEPAGIFNAEEAVPEETSADEPIQTISEEKNTLIDEPRNSQPELQDDQPEDTIESPKRNHGGLWYLLATVIALGTIGGLWYYNNQFVQAEKTDTSTQEEELTERPMTVPADTIGTEEEFVDVFSVNPADTANQAAQTAETPAQETPKVGLPANHRWYIVIGAHRSLSQAEDEVESYRKRGYPHVRMLPKSQSDTFIRVIWDSYVTKHEADSALQHVQQNHVPDAWHRERKNFN